MTLKVVLEICKDDNVDDSIFEIIEFLSQHPTARLQRVWVSLVVNGLGNYLVEDGKIDNHSDADRQSMTSLWGVAHEILAKHVDAAAEEIYQLAKSSQVES